jgi:hypothetical protein
MTADDRAFEGWSHREPTSNGRAQCRASWAQEEWAFWCGLEVGHDGPHQEVGRSADRAYLVLWTDPDRED